MICLHALTNWTFERPSVLGASRWKTTAVGMPEPWEPKDVGDAKALLALGGAGDWGVATWSLGKRLTAPSFGRVDPCGTANQFSYCTDLC